MTDFEEEPYPDNYDEEEPEYEEIDQEEELKPLNFGEVDPSSNQNTIPVPDSEDEGINDYKLGGYHPVHIGEVLLSRYIVLSKLGWGHFSTVWLSKDTKHDTYVAIKIMKSSPHYMEAALDEVEFLQKVANNCYHPDWIASLKEYYSHVEFKLKKTNRKSFNRDDCHVIQLFNSFIHRGPYGDHFCMVFEILGVNLLEIIKRYNYKGIPIDLCREVTRQCLIGLDFLHRFCNSIHTDLKPENVLVCMSREEIVKLVEEKTQGINCEVPETLNNSCTLSKTLTRKQKKLQRAHEKRKNKKKQKRLQGSQKDDSTNAEKSQPKEDPQETAKASKKKKKSKNKKKKDSNVTETFTERESVKCDEEVWNPPIKVKIADLGNACWFNHHFSTEIQTRQYRSPEVIIGCHYNETADIWSLACMVFELLTGEFLFEPRKGNHFSKNDDHLAQMAELLRRLPLTFCLSGRKSHMYFDQKGNLKKIPELNFWPLIDVIVEKYQIKVEEATALNAFLLPMLEYDPKNRISAKDAINNPWLYMRTGDNFYMNETELTAYNSDKGIKQLEQEFLLEKMNINEGSDVEFADSEDNFLNEEEEEDSFYEEIKQKVDMKIIDRSFCNLGYIGFGDGIDFETLDQTKNWQFDAD